MWNPNTLKAYQQLIEPMIHNTDIQSMAALKQHAKGVSCLDHSIFVSYLSFSLCRQWNLNSNAAARAGLLHDMFLFDRETTGTSLWKHLRLHPQLALENSIGYGLSPLEKDIILTHMWPVTLFEIPRHRESFVVNLADKICTVCEVLRLYRMLGVRKKLGYLNQSAYGYTNRHGRYARPQGKA